MGACQNWWFGGEPNPPKISPTVRPWGDDSWREHGLHEFTVFVPLQNDSPRLPTDLAGTVMPHTQLDLLEYLEEHHERNTFS